MRHAKAKRANAAAGELQRMWLHVAPGAWRSLAVIPMSPEIATLPIAESILPTASFFDLGSFDVIDATGVSLGNSTSVSQRLASALAAGRRAVLAMNTPFENGGSLPLAIGADAAVLAVRLRSSRIAATKDVIEMLGRDRVLGCIAVR